MSAIGLTPGQALDLVPGALETAARRAQVEEGNGSAIFVGGGPRAIPKNSFSGCDIRASVFVPGDAAKPHQGSAFRTLAELQTITISSHRGVTPVRFLGEHWAREYIRGSRTIAGTMIFSLLEEDVFKPLYRMAEREAFAPTPYVIAVDQLPPMTITIMAVNEYGRAATMALLGVRLVSYGMTLSVDDILTETTYQYVATWATPFMGVTGAKLLRRITQTDALIVERASTYSPSRVAARTVQPPTPTIFGFPLPFLSGSTP